MRQAPAARAASARLNTGPRGDTMTQSMTAPRSGPGWRTARSAPLPSAPPAISPSASARPRLRTRSPAPTAASVASAPARVMRTISSGRPRARPKATPVLRTSRVRTGPSWSCGTAMPSRAATAHALLAWSATATARAASGKSTRPVRCWGFIVGLLAPWGPMRKAGPERKPGGVTCRFPMGRVFGHGFGGVLGRGSGCCSGRGSGPGFVRGSGCWSGRGCFRGYDGGPAGVVACGPSLSTAGVRRPYRRGYSDVFPLAGRSGAWYLDSIFILFLSTVFQSFFRTPPVSPEFGFRDQ